MKLKITAAIKVSKKWECRNCGNQFTDAQYNKGKKYCCPDCGREETKPVTAGVRTAVGEGRNSPNAIRKDMELSLQYGYEQERNALEVKTPMSIQDWYTGKGCPVHSTKRSNTCHDCAMLQPDLEAEQESEQRWIEFENKNLRGRS